MGAITSKLRTEKQNSTCHSFLTGKQQNLVGTSLKELAFHLLKKKSNSADISEKRPAFYN